MRDISAKLPASLGMSGSQVQRLLDGLTDHALRNVQAIAPRMDPAKLPAELRPETGRARWRHRAGNGTRRRVRRPRSGR